MSRDETPEAVTDPDTGIVYFPDDPTPDASPDPAVVTPDAGDAPVLDELAALELAEEVWEDEPTDAEQELMQRVLASDWLANHVAAAREADRAEVERAITEHAAHMGTYTLPALAPGFLDGYHHALRLLNRDADVIAHRATRGESS